MKIKGYWSKSTIEYILLPIVRDRIVTETELLKKVGGRSTSKLNMAYQCLVKTGFPIKRKVVFEKKRKISSKGGASRGMYVKDRVVIYYLD